MSADRPRWRSRAWLVATIMLCMLVVLLGAVGGESPADAVSVLGVAVVIAMVIIIWAQVRIRGQRREYEQALATWVADRATQAERLRIAAELHDLVSHGLGLITVRAAAARHVTGVEADQEKENALADIEQAGRETTTELRRMLTVLRDSGTAPLRPADTLDDLPTLVAAARTAGLTVVLELGEVGDVSPGVQMTICTIVREALNNTLRHAGPTHARIRVHREGAVIVVDIHDDGPRGEWRPQPGAGQGLKGLDERVTMLQGTLFATHTDDGFQLTACIPEQECR